VAALRSSNLISVLLNRLDPAADCNRNGILDRCDLEEGRSADGNGNGTLDECESGGTLFVRGDCNQDGEVQGVITDAVFLLNFNFLEGREPECLAACDANGDGQVLGVVTDAVHLLTYNFLGGPAPAAPFPACGPGQREGDETLGCAVPPPGCRQGV
jgi:hypothetical protein